jgi:molybdopterin-guanine dinucleotide biosynthesis protein B
MKVIGLAGWSGAGKTTLLTRVIPQLVGEGLKVSTMKHAHHAFDMDIPGKDSWRHREAGASEVLVASAKRFALLHELRDEEEPKLASLLTRLSPVDLVIVEGFKFEAHPKIEVCRVANDKPFLHVQDPHILGLVTDGPRPTHLPGAHLDDIPAVAAMMRALARPLADVLARLNGEV